MLNAFLYIRFWFLVFKGEGATNNASNVSSFGTQNFKKFLYGVICVFSNLFLNASFCDFFKCLANLRWRKLNLFFINNCFFLLEFSASECRKALGDVLY